VTSSDIYSIGYDPIAKILEIEFVRKDIYQYINVPQTIFDQIMAASSHGKF